MYASAIKEFANFEDEIFIRRGGCEDQENKLGV
jgi:hypothetical protein